jgi:predicted TIM-barrel fold metal-dependent hydrolase
MVSRRELLTTTAAAGASLAMVSSGSEPARAQPARRIIVDAQVHLWLAHTPERPWPPDGIGQAHIPRPFLTEELLVRMDEAGVDRVVIVPPSWEGFRNEYALEAAKKWPHRFAVMGRLRLDDPASREKLATWKEQPGMLGVRHTFNRLQTG